MKTTPLHSGHKISNICHCTGRRIEAPKSPRSSAELTLRRTQVSCSTRTHRFLVVLSKDSSNIRKAANINVKNAEGARGGVWGGVSPSGGVPLPTGDGVWGGGCALSPKIFWTFQFLISKWWAFVDSGWYYLPFSCLFARKKWCLWSSKTKTYCCLRARRDGQRDRDTERGRAKQK